MEENYFVTAVETVENSCGVIEIEKGKTYKVSDVEQGPCNLHGIIVTETGDAAYILFDGLPCAWQNGKEWIVKN